MLTGFGHVACCLRNAVKGKVCSLVLLRNAEVKCCVIHQGYGFALAIS